MERISQGAMRQFYVYILTSETGTLYSGTLCRDRPRQTKNK
jgi:predicted GIY-YIG superfamily endonuclease